MTWIKDDEFIRGNVPMTKREIRILTLAQANIQSGDTVIDVGAGTGSLSIESAKLARQVFSIEKNAEAVELIEQNVEKFGFDNIVVINAEAPNVLEAIHNFDVVLIGGSGGKLKQILETINRRIKLGGRIVINCITIQTIATAMDYFNNNDRYNCEAMQVQVNHLQRLNEVNMIKASNPIYIVTATRV